MTRFEHRVQMLPHLGIGVSTESGAHLGDGALDIERLYTQYPEFAAFLEVGVEVDKGLDEDTMRWLDLNRPTTYHFLDINLDDLKIRMRSGWLLSAGIVKHYSQLGCVETQGFGILARESVDICFCCRRSCRQNPRKRWQRASDSPRCDRL